MELCSGESHKQTDRHTDTTEIVVTAGAREPIQPTSTQGSDIKEKTSKMEPISKACSERGFTQLTVLALHCASVLEAVKF